MLEVNTKSTEALLRQDIEAGRQREAALKATNTELQARLNQAQEQVATIATKALDSASGALALDKVSSMSRSADPVRGKA